MTTLLTASLLAPLFSGFFSGTAELDSAHAEPAQAEQPARSPKLESGRLLTPLTLGPFTSEIGVVESLQDLQTEVAPAGKSDGSFQQELLLQAYGGTSSKLTLRTGRMADLQGLRLIAVVDGVLRVVPFSGGVAEESPTASALLARFLTPSRSLQYQIQFLFLDGRSQLTKWFSLSESCFQRVPVQELVGVSEEKRQLIAELVALDRDSARLTHALSSMQKLAEVR